MGHVPPSSLLSVAAILEKEGIEVQLIDMVAESLSYEDTLERVRKFSPAMLGFTLTTYSFHSVINWMKRFKADTGLPILAGGAHAVIYPDETMTHPEIDYLVLGEADCPLPEFIRRFQDGGNFAGMKSFAYRKDGQVIVDRTVEVIKNIDDAPLPALHLVKNELYGSILAKRKNYTALMSSRGCPYRCTFCDQKKVSYRMRSPQSLVGEIRRNYFEFGIRDFDIWDSTFTANEERVMQICDRLAQERMNINWHIRARVDSVNESMLDALKRAGCKTVLYGIESSNHDILKRMKKDITTERVEHIIAYTKRAGMQTLGYFMFGYPGETRATMEETIRFALRLPLDYVQMTVMVPFPDTEIYEYYRERGLGDYWSRFTLDLNLDEEIELVETELSRAQTVPMVNAAYRRFFFRPSIILKRLIDLRSFGQFQRLFGGALGLARAE
jgi:anaerobic magnesium-protoporphyrin IX monomethyl ester cyclase